MGSLFNALVKYLLDMQNVIKIPVGLFFYAACNFHYTVGDISYNFQLGEVDLIHICREKID